MGCDINIHFEIKINDKWEHYSSPYLNRNYSMFGWLAGVRVPEAQVIKTKGLPKDISVVTQIDWETDEEDWHTPSWLSAEEIALWVKQFSELHHTSKNNLHPPIGYLFGNSFEYWSEYPNEYPDVIEDLRMVFWFDN